MASTTLLLFELRLFGSEESRLSPIINTFVLRRVPEDFIVADTKRQITQDPPPTSSSQNGMERLMIDMFLTDCRATN
jgi:hypothetical protein